MNIFALCGVCVLTVLAVVLLRSVRPEYGLVLRLSFGVFCGWLVLERLGRIVSEMGALADMSGGGEMLRFILQALGIGIVCQAAAAICRDCGETTLAQGVETVGKLEILLSCLPLFRQVMGLAADLLSGF